MNRNVAEEIRQVHLECEAVRQPLASEKVPNHRRRTDFYIYNIIRRDDPGPSKESQLDPVGVNPVLLPKVPEQSPGFIKRLFTHFRVSLSIQSWAPAAP